MGKLVPRSAVAWVEFGALLAMLIIPFTADRFWILSYTRILILALLAISFDLVWGYVGILSFGQALFFGVAGYGAAILAVRFGITEVYLVLPLAAIVGLFISSIVAMLVIFGKRPPATVFVALSTLAASYVVDRLVRGWSFVGGQNGIPSIPRMTFAGGQIREGLAFYLLAGGVLILVYLGSRWLVRSQFGLALAGIRENEDRLAFLGYRTQRYKGFVFCMAGAIAGLAGGLYAFHEGFVGPGLIGPVLSTQAVVYALLGGVGTLIGAAIGTVLLEVISFYASQWLEVGWPIFLGFLLLAVVTLQPSGLIGLIANERARIGRFGRPLRKKESSGDA